MSLCVIVFFHQKKHNHTIRHKSERHSKIKAVTSVTYRYQIP